MESEYFFSVKSNFTHQPLLFCQTSYETQRSGEEGRGEARRGEERRGGAKRGEAISSLPVA